MAVRYETGGGRATITIDDPEHRNPMSVEAMGELLEFTRQAMDDADVSVLVYTGAGDKVFSTSWSIGGALPEGFAADLVASVADLVADGSARWVTPAEVIDSAR